MKFYLLDGQEDEINAVVIALPSSNRKRITRIELPCGCAFHLHPGTENLSVGNYRAASCGEPCGPDCDQPDWEAGLIRGKRTEV